MAIESHKNGIKELLFFMKPIPTYYALLCFLFIYNVTVIEWKSLHSERLHL